MRAIAAAAHVFPPAARQARARQTVQVGQPLAGAEQREPPLGVHIAIAKAISHIGADLETRGPDGWPEPCDEVFWRAAETAQCFDRGFEHARAKAAPACMSDPTALPCRSAKSTGRQSAVRTAHTTPRSRVTAASAIGAGSRSAATVGLATVIHAFDGATWDPRQEPREPPSIFNDGLDVVSTLRPG